MPEAVVFGAGSVGRGFIAQLFTRAGYRVTFVDVDELLVEALNARGGYTLTLVTNESRQEVAVGPVRAIHSRDAGAVVEVLQHASLAATAVGAEPLRLVAPLLARSIATRMAAGTTEPLNIIVCENLPDQAGYLRGLLDGLLGEDERGYLQEHVGLVNAVIARMVPAPTAEMRARDISGILTEPYYDLPVDGAAWRGTVPAIPGLQAVSPFAPYIVRKLYICNGLHALLAYLGYRRGHALACDAVDDLTLRPLLEGGLRESAAGLAHAYGEICEGCRPAALEALISSLWPRLANRALADPLHRLARDPLRKLAPRDRIVGPARLAEAAGVFPEHLAWGIAGALAYDDADDPAAVGLQERIAEQGAAVVLAQVAGIAAGEPLGRRVLEAYERLKQGAWPA